MTIRPTQSSLYNQVQSGIRQGQIRVLRAQLQIATGKRVSKPSDDPRGSSRLLSLRQRLAGGERFSEAARTARTRVDAGAGSLQEVSSLVSEAREILIQGMSGTVNDGDRLVLAESMRRVREQILGLANTKGSSGFLFAGTKTDVQPFQTTLVGGREAVVYAGDGQGTQALVGEDLLVPTGLPGDVMFGLVQRSGTTYAGLTGVAAGTSGDVGQGRVYLDLVHTGTSATLGAGVALVGGGASDTILGAHSVTVDGVAGTVQLDNGKLFALPQPGDPDLSDFTIVNEHGAELHLDFSGFTGTSFSGSADGQGTISLDGVTALGIDFLDTDLQLSDPATGASLHVDTTGIHRAGVELVTFGGAVNLFDALQGIVDDLENVDGLAPDEQAARLSLWLDELDRNHDNLIVGLGKLGGSSASLIDVEARLENDGLALSGTRSAIEDTDFAQAVLDMTQAEQTLQLAQATGARLVSTSLLDFLR